MPKTINTKAIEFCEEFNKDGSLLPNMHTILDQLIAPFTEGDIAMLRENKYDISPDNKLAANCKGVRISPRVFASFVGYLVSWIDNDENTTYKMRLDLHEVLMPDHVTEFLAAIAKENNGWGTSGRTGLMYRGHNVFDIYTDMCFNRTITNMISNDPEVRAREKCEKCRVFLIERMNDCDCEDFRKAAEKFCEKNMIKPEDITSQEVYLGYNPIADTFCTAWDVFGSENTGSLLISFVILEDGTVGQRSHHGDTYAHTIDTLEDGFCGKFYDRYKGLYDNTSGHPAGTSPYDMVSTARSPEWKLVDIRLD